MVMLRGFVSGFGLEGLSFVIVRSFTSQLASFIGIDNDLAFNALGVR